MTEWPGAPTPLEPSDSAGLARLAELVEGWLHTQMEQSPVVDTVEADTAGPRRWFVRLLGDEREAFTVWFHLDQRTLRYESYFCPAPEENEAEFFRHLLARNQKMYGAAFCVGAENAVYLRGQIEAVDEAALDRILGSLYVWGDQFFRPALRIGFASRFERSRRPPSTQAPSAS